MNIDEINHKSRKGLTEVGCVLHCALPRSDRQNTWTDRQTDGYVSTESDIDSKSIGFINNKSTLLNPLIVIEYVLLLTVVLLM